jgi:hypothetical protein
LSSGSNEKVSHQKSKTSSPFHFCTFFDNPESKVVHILTFFDFFNNTETISKALDDGEKFRVYFEKKRNLNKPLLYVPLYHFHRQHCYRSNPHFAHNILK